LNSSVMSGNSSNGCAAHVATTCRVYQTTVIAQNAANKPRV